VAGCLPRSATVPIGDCACLSDYACLNQTWQSPACKAESTGHPGARERAGVVLQKMLGLVLRPGVTKKVLREKNHIKPS
jgi:hypothetical protein